MSRLPDWSKLNKEERTAALRPLVSQGLSANAIALQFSNASRNAVISQCSRCGLKLARGLKRGSWRAEPEKPKPKAAKRAPNRTSQAEPAKAEIAPVPRQTLQAVKPAVVPAPIARAKAFEPLIGVAPVHLADLGALQCHWPVNGHDGIHPIFCGASASETYCTSHARLAYLPRGHRGAL
ncbi:UNVERIFIED_ORG: hypothetical protein LHK14_17760 [Roseateles sp. XES5]|nr:GcrA family cell cycle regulator [Roseateles sp. XES5]